MGGYDYFTWMHFMNIIADQGIPHIEHFFGKHASITLLPGRQITHDALQHADGLLVRSITTVNEALLKNTPVKWVGSLTAGTDHLDIEWLTAESILWRACPGFNAPPVADYVVSTLAALMNQGHLRSEKKRAAVIGVGNVGSLVVKRLQTLGFEVLLVDPPRAETDASFSSLSLQDIHDVDLVCIHTPLTKKGVHATYHMINADFLQKQKPGCVILNAARGAVLDTKTILSHGQHLIFCLDVFEHEPNINIEILNHTHIATPHIAGHAVESKWRGVLSLYEWLQEAGYLPKAAITQNIAPCAINLPSKTQHWHNIVQYVFDIMQISNEMHDTLNNNVSAIGIHFDRIRKQHGNRCEFTNIILNNINKIAAHDQQILKQLGFIL